MHHGPFAKHNLELHYTEYEVIRSISRSWMAIQTENLVLYMLTAAGQKLCFSIQKRNQPAASDFFTFSHLCPF